jgi:hypothetical protein
MRVLPGRIRVRVPRSLLLTAAIPLIYVVVYGAFLFREGDSDWDQMLSFHELSLWNSRLFGLAKHWNPLMRGGMSLAGDPQVPIFSPSMILARMIDPAAAIKISCLFFVLAGAAGAWLLARDLALDGMTAALAAALFAGNGYIVSRLSHGHTAFLGTLGLPLWLWAARRCLPRPGEDAARAGRRLAWLILGGGVFFALSTDGAPIALLLLLVWIGLDTSVLAWQKRSARPLLFFAGSVVVAFGLDAIYYLPVVANAELFPRTRPAVFLDPLLFLWFLLLPVRGKVLPAPANGHEFSVYIGPVLAYLLITYRGRIFRAIPSDDRRRFLLVSAATFVLGLGAWRALGRWLPPGPFDILHEFPGFEAIGIPSRFWGYLALPLALACAVAVRSLEQETSPARPRRLLWGALFAFTVGFQAISLALPFLSATGSLIVPHAALPRAVHAIHNVPGPEGSQAEEIGPTTDLIDAYNAHDYIQGAIAPGTALVLQARDDRGSAVPAVAEWNGWSRIDLRLPAGSPPGARIVLNQNFHPLWSSSLGVVTRNGAGNLSLRLHQAAAAGSAITLAFRDPSSILGSRVSAVSAIAFLCAVFTLSGSSLRARASAGQRAVGLKLPPGTSPTTPPGAGW